jgi:hypothetical protein
MIKFTLSENPNKPGCRSEGGAGLFIIHHLQPISIIEVDLVTQLHPATDTSHCYTYNGQTKEYWQLTLQFCYQQVGAPDVDVHKLLKRAWHWHAAYLEWEDNNIDTDEQATFN